MAEHHPLWKKIAIWAWLHPIRESPPTLPAGAPAAGSLSEEFSGYVKAASELLDFLIKEGLHPIRDQVIDDIESAREIARSGTPTKEDHAKLMRAYRDLALVPRITIVASKVPPTTFWGLESPWPGVLIWASLVPSIVGLIAIAIFRQHVPRSVCFLPIVYFILSVFAISTLYVFSGTVTNSKLNQIIRYCYAFTGFALLGTLLPFMLPGLFSHVEISAKAPLGILEGCVNPTTDDAKRAYPKEVQCRDSGIQWIANLGGTVTVRSSSADSVGKTVSLPEAGKIPAGKVDAEGSGANATAPAPARKWGEINGGLVVPLYVIVLALFGGAISMTRRVPEYQRRAMDSQDVLTNAEARERLVFQIMQVATAPLIAVTTYYIILPDTPLKSVLVGFGSGFASEPILLMIRALVEKLNPAPPAPPAGANSAISITMTPPSAIVPPRSSMQFAAIVTGGPNTQILWLLDPPDASSGTISQNGLYVAPETQPTKGVTITARSVADSTKFATASVRIEPIVTVAPATETLEPGKECQFSAEVLGLSDPGVTWSIDPATEGQILNGLYTAPATTGATRMVTVVARSKVDPTRFGSAKVKLAP